MIALVTGGARGIGRTIAKTLHKVGYTVVVNYNKSKELAESLEKELKDRVFTIQADISKEEEVYAMGVEKREIVVNYNVGDTVRILDGPFSSFTGTVEAIEVDKNSVSVVVTMFGRETSVEFELDQVEVTTP